MASGVESKLLGGRGGLTRDDGGHSSGELEERDHEDVPHSVSYPSRDGLPQVHYSYVAASGWVMN